MGGPVEQSEFWERRADAWDRHADAVELFAGQFGGPAMEVLAPVPGEHLADVGCGPGITTIELGGRVGPEGSVTGVDVSARMVASARARAAEAHVGNVRFEVGDPGAGPIGSFDGIFSRFGVMFFDDPAVAFANLARSIRPGGRLVAAVWAELGANPWMSIPTLFGAGPLEAELSPPGPDEPGPFSLADPERTVALLESSGFEAVHVDRHEAAWTIDAQAGPGSFGQMLALGPLGEAWAAAGDDARTAAVDAVRAGCDDHRNGRGWRLPAAALVVSAPVGR